MATWLAEAGQNWLKIARAGRHRLCYVVGMGFGWRSAFFAILATVALGCTSPTLPLPPPAAPSETRTDPTTITLNGANAVPEALIVVRNPNTQFTGTEVDEATTVAHDGTWTVTIQAVKDDELTILEFAGDEDSSSTYKVQF